MIVSSLVSAAIKARPEGRGTGNSRHLVPTGGASLSMTTWGAGLRAVIRGRVTDQVVPQGEGVEPCAIRGALQELFHLGGGGRSRLNGCNFSHHRLGRGVNFIERDHFRR